MADGTGSKSGHDCKAFNILMLGETQVGKTALIKRYHTVKI